MLFHWEPQPAGPFRVAFSTRLGGVSDGPFASLNLGRLTEDDPARVEENRRRVCAAVDADATLLALNRQVHGASVHRARPGVRGNPGDALWTDEAGVPILALTADCVPVAAVAGGRVALAVLHVGWRGLLAGVVRAGVRALGGARAACVGPAIGPCCYDVGADVRDPFVARYGRGAVRGRRVDLWSVTERALREEGVSSVERIDLCTSCNPQLFFSHRRDSGVTGRQGVLGVVVG